jgi:hypothetical protein
MNRGVVIQDADFTESRCTNHILQSLPFNGRLRFIAEVQAGKVGGSD